MLYLHVVQQRQVMGPQVCRPIQPLLACNDQCMTARLWESIIDDYTVRIDLHLRVLVSVPAHVVDWSQQHIKMLEWVASCEH